MKAALAALILALLCAGCGKSQFEACADACGWTDHCCERCVREVRP